MDDGRSVGELAAVRRTYDRDALDLADLTAAERAAPLLAVARWLDEAIADGRDPEPTAMVLATVARVDGDDPRPDARVVLCKGIDEGVVLYGNRRSSKGRQLAAQPRAALVFRWAALERQVRVRGTVTALDDATADAYFASRPRGSRVGAWASEQSAPIADRASLDARAAEVDRRFADGEVPRPPDWGGYRVLPDEVELWQGRPDRLHDRLLAVRGDAGWTWTRLQP